MVERIISKVWVKITMSGFATYTDKQHHGINTNLLARSQKFGIQIYDDPNDPHRNLGIEASEDLFIPMIMQGSTCGIITNPPTDNKIHERQNIIPSDKFDWDPSNIFFEMSSMEEEYRTSSSFC